ncbi:gp33 late promoter transcription accessory protein [Delftia phage PhiW-14]|uniref:Gp33 late promoter transcription accessory protein n=1 Tax=Delftia phage PhiW-14 TaxID=665032 RepID=C9DFZ2_BPW14|nr:gp33 late promoter transcription accessory protein [Delftia phage PhiW-14]ACV50043.1 gp33 late promoter transcription accessory protein [Delftia phage PhiW-14]
MTTEFKTHDQISFALRVEEIVESGIEDNYISAVSHVLEEMDMEPEDAVHLISKTLVGKMEAEALNRRLLKARNNTTSLGGFAAT